MAIEGIGLEPSLFPTETEPKPGGERFSTALGEYLLDVNRDQVVAAKKIREFAIDGEGSIQEAMVAMSKAEGSFRLLMEMRNRMVQAVNRLLQTRV